MAKIKTKTKKERMPIKFKLTMSHILIGVIPMLIVVILLLSTAKGIIIDEVKVANHNLTLKVASNLNMLTNDIVDVSTMAVSEFVKLVVA